MAKNQFSATSIGFFTELLGTWICFPGYTPTYNYRVYSAYYLPSNYKGSEFGTSFGTNSYKTTFLAENSTFFFNQKDIFQILKNIGIRCVLGDSL